MKHFDEDTEGTFREPRETKLPSVEQLLDALEHFKDMSDEDKEELKNSLLQSSKRSEAIDSFLEKSVESGGSSQIVILLCLVAVVLLILVFFGYKLYQSISEKQRKREEKRKYKEQKKKK